MKSPLPNSQARATWLGFAPMASAMVRTISTAFMLASKFSPWKRGSNWRWSFAVHSSARLTLPAKTPRPTNHSADQERIAYLQKKIQTKDEVLAELMAEHVALKKDIGEL